MLKLIDINNDFQMAAVQDFQRSASYRHEVIKGHLNGSKTCWIRKEIKNPLIARIELLAQEFFRLLIPYQPRTLLAKNFNNGVYYILSEEVEQYRRLPKGYAECFENGTYLGLAKALVISVFLQEIDLKNGNIGLDKWNRVIKIDGDWCFGSITYRMGSYPLTSGVITSLPYPKLFYVFNWIDWVSEGAYATQSHVVNLSLNRSFKFRKEINQSLLQIALLPDLFIERFVDCYLLAGGQRFIDLIRSRRDELTKSALEIPSFFDYLMTADAQKDAQLIFNQMKTFRVDEDQLVIPINRQDEFANGFRELKKKFFLQGLSYQNKMLDKTLRYSADHFGQSSFNQEKVNQKYKFFAAIEKNSVFSLEGVATCHRIKRQKQSFGHDFYKACSQNEDAARYEKTMLPIG